jgi:hypothetical protein
VTQAARAQQLPQRIDSVAGLSARPALTPTLTPTAPPADRRRQPQRAASVRGLHGADRAVAGPLRGLTAAATHPANTAVVPQHVARLLADHLPTKLAAEQPHPKRKRQPACGVRLLATSFHPLDIFRHRVVGLADWWFKSVWHVWCVVCGVWCVCARSDPGSEVFSANRLPPSNCRGWSVATCSPLHARH